MPADARTLVLWCPDWPAVAAARQAGIAAAAPVAVLLGNRVVVCTAAARAEGVRVGMRRREAQSRCPELAVLTSSRDLAGDLEGVAGRLFEPVVAAVEELAPGVEVLRPGLIALAVRGPRRWFGDEVTAAERLTDAVEALDVEARVGIADGLAVAVLAARRSRIVPPGGDAGFCAGLPLTDLARDPAIAPPERAALVDLWHRLGLRTAGDLAGLPVERVASRFGADGLAAHRLAGGTSDRGTSRRVPPGDLTLEQECDPPLHRVDTAAFLGRALAERFHASLAAAGLACTRLTITATFTDGRSVHRTWRAARPLTAAATADRIRWQLDGWLTGRALRRQPPPGSAVPGRSGRPSRPVRRGRPGTDGAVPDGDPGSDLDGDLDSAGVHGIVRLALHPVEAVDAGRIQYGLWGSDGADDHRAGWACARIQGLLGPRSVLTPVLSGGRTPVDRVTTVSWGDERVPDRDPAAPWPGALPAPSPGALADRPLVVALTDAAGEPVLLDERGALSAPPVRAGERQVTGWAGPWLFDERWWDQPVPPHRLVTAPAVAAGRLQVLCEDATALLVRFVPAGPGRWELEGVYD